MALWNQIGAEVITLKISGITPDDIDGMLIASGGFTGEMPVGTPVTTAGAAFDGIGLHAGDTPGTYAVALGGMVVAPQDGSITTEGYQLVGATTNCILKSVESGGRPVSILYAGDDFVVVKF